MVAGIFVILVAVLAEVAIEALGIFDAVGDVKKAVVPVEVHSFGAGRAEPLYELEAALAGHAGEQQKEEHWAEKSFDYH